VPKVFRLVLRNIARNKRSSAIVALLIAVITFLFFIGNTIIGRSNQGIRAAFIQSLTGDVVLQAKADVTMNLFGANTPIIDAFFTIPVLPAYDDIMEIVNAEEGIAGITSQVSGRAFLDLLGVREPVLLCGADAPSYFSLFPGILLEEGWFLYSGEYGAMITAERARGIERQSGQYPQIGSPLLFTSGGAMGFKIREVPLVGIFSYVNPGQFMNEIVIIDPQTVRALNSIQVAGFSDVQLAENALRLLDTDMDVLFNDIFAEPSADYTEEFSAETLRNYLSDAKTEDAELSGGDWNFIILRLENEKSSSAFISALNKKIESYGVTAVDWRTAAGTSAILLLLIQALFNAGIFLVCVAGVITAINILLISVFRRVREIGTLRAIGAGDAYIRSLILQENIVIAIIAGFIGVFCGFLFIRLFNALALQIPNALLASLLGGSVLTLQFLPGVAFASFLLSALLGFFASIYPMEITVRIEPMAALRRG